MNTLAEYELSYQLSAGAIDAASGVIKGATVAQAGVKALGKFVFLDKAGKLTRDEDEAVKKVPVYTDEKTLETLMAAAGEDGGIFKVRSDHSDALEARAGYAVNFTRQGNRVSADLKLNDSYRDRDIVLETAAKTPRLIGLSIDSVPSFEIVGTGDEMRALMRVEKLIAVDIVDGGAITHDGIFLQSRVDKTPTIKLATSMPDQKPTPPTVEECMSRLSKLADDFSAMQASIAKMAAPPAPVPAPDAELKASVTKLSEQMAGITENLLQMKKTASALGMSAGASPSGEDAEKERLKLAADKAAADATKNLTFSAEAENRFKASGGKVKRSEIKAQLMKEKPELYRAHLSSLGVTRAA